MYGSDTFSDMEIVFDDKTSMKVHKAFVCAIPGVELDRETFVSSRPKEAMILAIKYAYGYSCPRYRDMKSTMSSDICETLLGVIREWLGGPHPFVALAKYLWNVVELRRLGFGLSPQTRSSTIIFAYRFSQSLRCSRGDLMPDCVRFLDAQEFLFLVERAKERTVLERFVKIARTAWLSHHRGKVRKENWDLVEKLSLE